MRVAVLGCLFLALVVFAVGMSALTARAWDRALERRDALRTSATEVADLRLAFSDQETGVRGYLLTGGAESLALYQDGIASERATLAQIRATSEVDIDDELGRVEQAAAQWRDDVARPALEDPGQPFDGLLARARSDVVRAELQHLDDTVQDELARSMQRTDDVKRNTFGVLIASAIAAVVAICLVAALFRRWVTRPLAQIGASARALSVDDTTELPDFDSAELQDVVDAIRTLQQSLALERDRAVTAYKTLEQSAVLAVHVRSELADELGDPPPGWAVGSALVPAEGAVAGDCFDLGLLDQHHMYVVLVDVTGHGAGAALDALKSKSQLRAAIRSRVSPGGALDWLSRENRKDERADLLTAVVAIIDVDTGVCHYANAGHPAPMLSDGREHVLLARTGPLLGAFESSWRTETVTIEPGWTLLLHTDGVTEAMGPGRERFGPVRFRDFLDDANVSDPKTLVADLLGSVRTFQTGRRTDDITVVAIHRAPTVAAHDPEAIQMDTVQP